MWTNNGPKAHITESKEHALLQKEKKKKKSKNMIITLTLKEKNEYFSKFT